MRNILIIILFSLSLLSSAQPDLNWASTYGTSTAENGRIVRQTNDNGFILGGEKIIPYDTIPGYSRNIWLVKLDNNGSTEWQKEFGGSFWEWLYDIQQTSDNGYIFTGIASSMDGDVIGNHGIYDMWVVKLDSIGNIEWQKCLGGTKRESGNKILLSDDGGYIIGGLAESNDGDVSGVHITPQGHCDAWLVKLDSIGNIEWQKCYGGYGTDSIEDIEFTSDNGFIFVATVIGDGGDITNFHGGWDYWVVKLDSIGNIEWQKCYGGTGKDAGTSIQPLADKGFIVSGYAESNNGDVSGNHGGFDIWTLKIDSVGTIEWQKCYGGSEVDYTTCIQKNKNNGFIISGATMSNDGDVIGNQGDYDYWMIETDYQGNIVWQKCIGGSDEDRASHVIELSINEYITIGETRSVDGDIAFNHGFSDYFVVKFGFVTTIALSGSSCEGNYKIPVIFNNIDSCANFSLCLTFDTTNLSFINSINSSSYLNADSLIIIPGSGEINIKYSNIIPFSVSTDTLIELIFDIDTVQNDYIENLNWVDSSSYYIDFYGDSLQSRFKNCSLQILAPIGIASPIVGIDTLCYSITSASYSTDGILNANSYYWNIEPAGIDSLIFEDTLAIVYFQEGYIGSNILSVYGTNGCGVSDTSLIEINVLDQLVSNAGADISICEYSACTLNGSFQNGAYTYWASLGDGNFDDPFLLNATYTPGIDDIENEHVELILFAFPLYPCIGEVGDTISLNIIKLPEAYAGEDDSVCAGEPYGLEGVSDNHSSTNWFTSGDGFFDSPEQLSTYYHPGTEDISEGWVNITLAAHPLLPCDTIIYDSLT